MKLLNHFNTESVSNIFLYSVIMFANIDYIGILDYTLKAAAGGIVWFLFKLLQDYYSVRMQHKAHQHNKADKQKISGNENSSKDSGRIGARKRSLRVRATVAGKANRG